MLRHLCAQRTPCIPRQSRKRYEINYYKTGVINDPLDQPTARPAVKICFVSVHFNNVGTYGRYDFVKTVITIGRVWVGLVDQQDRSHQ